jgi:capsular polysaccharide biosynthesis protein
VDVGEQFAALRARWVSLLLAALLVGAAVYVASDAQPEGYTATSTLQVRLADEDTSDPSVRADFFAETLIGFATSRAVVAEAMTAAGRTEDVEDVIDDVVAESAEAPGFVTLSAPGSTPAGAVRLADEIARATAARVAAEQAADQDAAQVRLEQMLARVLDELAVIPANQNAERSALIRERAELVSALRGNAEDLRWRATVSERATLPRSPSSPQPERNAVLAMLLTLIVAAETLVIWRWARGAVSARDPAGDIGEILGAPVVVVRPDSAAALAPLLPVLESGGSPVTVLHLGPDRVATTAVLVCELLVARGESVLLVDAGPSRPSVATSLGKDRAPGLTDLPDDVALLEQAFGRLVRRRGIDVLGPGRGRVRDVATVRMKIAQVLEAAPHDRVVLAAALTHPDELLPLWGDGSLIDGPVVMEVDAPPRTRRAVADAVQIWRGLGVELSGATVRRGTPLARRLLTRIWTSPRRLRSSVADPTSEDRPRFPVST